MKRSKITILGLSVITAITLAGCGGGGSTVSNATSNTPSTDTSSSNEISKGYFIDAAVANAEYESESGLSGTTDENGTFEFIKGDKVKFHIGKLILGEIKPKDGEPVTPADLAENNKTKTLMLQLLQSLDSDHNTSNGITIPEEVIEDLKQKEPVNIHELNHTTVLNLNEKLKEHLDKDKDGKIDVDENEAKKHFITSVNKWKSKHSKNKNHQDSSKQSDNNKNHNDIDNDTNNSNKKPHNNGTINNENNSTTPDKNSHNKNNNQNGSKQSDNHDNMNNNSKDSFNQMPVIDIDSYQKYILDQKVTDAIKYMGNEERLAYDLYKNIFDYHAVNDIYINQLKNIANNSEIRHISTVKAIIDKYDIKDTELSKIDTTNSDLKTYIDRVSGKYDIEKIKKLYDALYAKGQASKQDALEVGCIVEVTDVNDLNEYIQEAKDINADDIVDAFTRLRDASYSHYWAFDKGLKNLGVTDGCCSLGEIDGVNYCQPNYPKEKKGNGNMNGNHGKMSGENNATNGKQHGQDKAEDAKQHGQDKAKDGFNRGENNASNGKQHGQNNAKDSINRGGNNATNGKQHGQDKAEDAKQHNQNNAKDSINRGKNNASNGKQHGQNNAKDGINKGKNNAKNSMNKNNKSSNSRIK
jgi:hypothetical protein